jgi:hypothetical protein
MKKQTVFVVTINRGIWNVFDSKEKVISLFRDELKGQFLFDEDGEVEAVDLEEGIEHLLTLGGCGEVAVCQNGELCEMGDDYCELSIIESEVK